MLPPVGELILMNCIVTLQLVLKGQGYVSSVQCRTPMQMQSSACIYHLVVEIQSDNANNCSSASSAVTDTDEQTHYLSINKVGFFVVAGQQGGAEEQLLALSLTISLLTIPNKPKCAISNSKRCHI